jgi:ComF family protein
MFKVALKKSLQTFSALGYRLLPGTCILCQAQSKRPLDLCFDCEQDLPMLGNCCQQCAMPLETNHSLLTCGQCLQTPPDFDRIIALFPYQMPIARLINDLKFQQRLANANVLGTLFAKRLATHYSSSTLPELIIPVPLHKERLKERGYNQALELARPISRILDIPINYQLCQRIRNTEHQTVVGALERRKNLRGAFFTVKSVPAHVAIIDDVLTTGSTVNELAKCLRTAGATQIDIWTIARTILGNHS